MVDINKFKEQLGGGNRQTLFRVVMTFPQLDGMPNGLTEKMSLLCKAAQLPGSTVGEIPVTFRGRDVKLPGDRSFDEQWTLTVLNDSEFDLRNAFEIWSNAIDQHKNIGGTAELNDVMVDAKVEQLDRKHNVIKEYTFESLFPSSVDPIDLSYEEKDAIEEFGVTLTYTVWTSNTTS